MTLTKKYIAMQIVMWKYHMGDFTESRYDMILGRYILYVLVIYIKFYKCTIVSGIVAYKGWNAPIFYLNDYCFKLYNAEVEIDPD